MSENRRGVFLTHTVYIPKTEILAKSPFQTPDFAEISRKKLFTRKKQSLAL